MIELQVQDAVADLLRAALVPVLRADVAAGAPRDVHLGLVGVAALRARPDQLTVLVPSLISISPSKPQIWQ